MPKNPKRKPLAPAPLLVDPPAPPHGTYPPAVLAAGAHAAYDGFVRESGHDKNATIMDYQRQPEHIKNRWERIARDVLDATGNSPDQQRKG